MKEVAMYKLLSFDLYGTLIDTPPAVVLRLLAQAVREELAPVPLLALLKHPLAAAGLGILAVAGLVWPLVGPLPLVSSLIPPASCLVPHSPTTRPPPLRHNGRGEPREGRAAWIEEDLGVVDGDGITVIEIWDSQAQHDKWFDANVKPNVPFEITQEVIDLHSVHKP
jgi:hypothetical protein